VTGGALPAALLLSRRCAWRARCSGRSSCTSRRTASRGPHRRGRGVPRPRGPGRAQPRRARSARNEVMYGRGPRYVYFVLRHASLRERRHAAAEVPRGLHRALSRVAGVDHATRRGFRRAHGALCRGPAPSAGRSAITRARTAPTRRGALRISPRCRSGGAVRDAAGSAWPTRGARGVPLALPRRRQPGGLGRAVSARHPEQTAVRHLLDRRSRSSVSGGHAVAGEPWKRIPHRRARCRSWRPTTRRSRASSGRQLARIAVARRSVLLPSSHGVDGGHTSSWCGDARAASSCPGRPPETFIITRPRRREPGPHARRTRVAT
jgi:hypothetical protein